MMEPYPPSTLNDEYSFAQLTPAQQNELLWHHNRWLLAQMSQAERLIHRLRTQQVVLQKLASKNDFYRQFSAEIEQDKGLTIQDLKRLKDLYRANPVLADMAVDELIDTINDRARERRLSAKIQLGIPTPELDEPPGRPVGST